MCKRRHLLSVPKGITNMCVWACNVVWLNPFKRRSSFCIVDVCKMILICLVRTRIFDFPGKGEMTNVKVYD